ncbi:MAG: glutamate--cysteine ligase, partial [Betaproteobacteria bacterium]|nr:glutamate--cysteine ligase [Betaproteobacteria bacterium]
MVPHLKTALNGPLLALEQQIIAASASIERWFRLAWQEHTPPFYGSVDLRHAGFKLSPVDMNLFPGGFNNLSEEMLPLAIHAAMGAIEKYCADARNLLLIPENHSRNSFYLMNVARLAGILRQTGLEVRLGSLNPELVKATELELPNGQSLLLEPLQRQQSANGSARLGLENFDPCAILLNNDLSAGIPESLRGLDQQVLLPPLHAGWAVRRKSHHFAAFDQVVGEFAQLLQIDPWLINPYFAVCQNVDFHERSGEQCMAEQVEQLLGRMRSKYREYGITEEAFVIVKADAGTYGMGVMSVTDPSQVVNLNRKQRNKMAVVKEGLEVSQVLLQEGVPTIEQLEGSSAEPVVYMIDRYVVGGFYRVHQSRSRQESLNAPGMHFVPLPFETSCILPDGTEPPQAAPNRFYAYGVVARLALLAAAIELEQ